MSYRDRPFGGGEQAKAISLASAALSKIRGRGWRIRHCIAQAIDSDIHRIVNDAGHWPRRTGGGTGSRSEPV
jgi:hypothetical protein